MNRSLRLLPLVLLGCLSCSDGGDARRPNVLLVSLDSTRRDLLSCYGRRPAHAPERSTSPTLDRLAASGVLMEEALAETSWTLVSHMSMLTGEPSVVHAVDEGAHVYGGSTPLLAEHLKLAGYRTAGFFSGPFLEASFGFARGFDRYEARYGAELDRASRRVDALRRAAGGVEEVALRSPEYRAALHHLMEVCYEDVSSTMVTDGVLEELDRHARTGEPFFVFAHYFDNHYDYVPPAAHDVFDPDYEGTIDGTDFLHSERIAGPKNGPGPRERVVSNRDLERVQALYEGEMLWTDTELARIVARLEELGALDHTLIVVTSDHGDEFFEHGSIGHRRTLFEEVVAVPLILRLPGVLPAGKRVAGPVSLVDLPATVLDAVGLPPPDGVLSRSFLPLVEGREEPGERGVFGRVVHSYGSTAIVPGKGGQEVRSLEVHVTETYRKGAIKITRERSWTKPFLPGGPKLMSWWSRKSKRERAEERLTWIDVELHPDEPLERHSTDWDDPRARAVLQEFHDRYVELLARRERSVTGGDDERLGAMLQGLGYTEGDDGEAEPVAPDDLVLPPPGEDVLGS